jgi:hypothetical protein
MDVSKLNGFKSDTELAASKDAFVNDFITRPEFTGFHNQFQTGDDYVNALIRDSGVTPASKQSLIDNYATLGRANTTNAFVLTTELQEQFFDRGFISMLYFGYLRRNPENGGFEFWMQRLIDTNHDYRSLVEAFLRSDEYQDRFAAARACGNIEFAGRPSEYGLTGALARP